MVLYLVDGDAPRSSTPGSGSHLLPSNTTEEEVFDLAMVEESESFQKELLHFEKEQLALTGYIIERT